MSLYSDNKINIPARETKTVFAGSGIQTIQVQFEKTYTAIPVVNVTTTSNSNFYLDNITLTGFQIIKEDKEICDFKIIILESIG